MGLYDLYEFELVPVNDGAIIAQDEWPRIRTLLLELQPSKRVWLVVDPPTAIRVNSYGGTKVAPDLLNQLSELAETPLRVSTV